MAINLPDVLSASPWQRVSFTTYALSLSFFEAVPLDLLTRAGAQNLTILADVEGVRAALGEQGARRVGKDYHVEPILVEGGVFHPKISILTTVEDCHLLIGSGNLTFGGWGNNLEVLEHLHPSFAANVFAGAGDFFQHLAVDGRITHRAKSTFEAISRDLARAAATGKPNSNLQFLHNLTVPIADQIAQAAKELGGATRITAGAPYWTKGAAEGLCRLLGQDRLYVHCHEGGSVRSTFGSNWPTGAAISLMSGRMEPLTEKGKQRLLHAKLVEVICRKGRLVFSGSANITAAALTQARNIEACLLRIDRVRKKGWGWEAVPAPEAQPALETDAQEGEAVGVLRATMANNRLHVTVLTPKMTGKVAVSRSTVDGRVDLGSATADAECSFVIGAADLEYLSWKDERLVLRVEQGGNAAEGFIAVTSYSDVRRRMGSIAGQIFAVLSGSETPADIAAMFSWFHEHPEVLDAAAGGGGGDQETETEDSTAVVRVSELTDIVDMTADIDEGRRQEGDHAWQRIMQNLLNAFRIKRTAAPGEAGGETPDGEDDEEMQAPEADSEGDGEAERFSSLLAFERLLALLLAQDQPLSRAIVAFDLTHYVCLQLSPEPKQALAWISGIFRALIERGGTVERHAEIAATVLLLHHDFPESGENDRDARLRLLRLGVSLEADTPAFENIPGFVNLFRMAGDWAATWSRLKQTKSLQEQVRAYREALRGGTPSPLDYPDLPEAAPVAWATLQQAIIDPEFRGEVITVTRPFSACPRCHRALPLQDVSALEACGIGLARDCCGKVLICEEV